MQWNEIMKMASSYSNNHITFPTHTHQPPILDAKMANNNAKKPALNYRWKKGKTWSFLCIIEIISKVVQIPKYFHRSNEFCLEIVYSQKLEYWIQQINSVRKRDDRRKQKKNWPKHTKYQHQPSNERYIEQKKTQLKIVDVELTMWNKVSGIK